MAVGIERLSEQLDLSTWQGEARGDLQEQVKEEIELPERGSA
jgi:hypothetical protein